MGGQAPHFASAMGVERRSAVWTDDAQVLEPVVIGHAVDVVEDHAHRPSVPDLRLPAQLADGTLQPCAIEAPLEVAAGVGGARNEDVLERNPLRPAIAQAGVPVEVLCGDLPALEPPAEQLSVVARRAQTEPAQSLCVRPRRGDRLTGLLLGVAGHAPDRTVLTGHEQAFVRELSQIRC
jgi:hypothetical protein